MAEHIQSWSYSRLTTFEQCGLRAKLAYVDKIPEPPRPLPPGKLEHANDRGTRVHDAAERFVKENIELIPELHKFKPEFQQLKEYFKKGKVSLEGDWATDRDWQPVNWKAKDAWLRMKLDALVRPTKTHGVVIDYKTGKMFGNEIKHAEQGQLYQLATFLRYPEIQTIDVEFWYTDIDDIKRTTFSRDQGLRFYRNFNDRGVRMTSPAADLAARPSISACRWCPFKNTEHCDKGV